MAVKFPVKVVLGAEDRNLTSTVRRTMGNLNAIGKRVSKIGKGVTRRVSRPLALVGAAALFTASRFERSMNTVRAVTNATGKDFDLLKKQALDLGATTRFTATQAADAMVNLGKAGLSVNEIYASMPGVLALAAATGTDLAEVARISAKALRGFGLEAKDSEKLTNALGIAALGANQTLETLGESLINAAPSLDGFGLSMEDTIALVSRFADVGFEGQRGGIALRNIILDLQKAVKTPGGAASETLKRLGIDPETLFDAKGQIGNLVEFLDRIRESGATAFDIPDIFGRRVVAPMIKMLKPLEDGVSTISAFSESLKVQGETARKAGIMNEGSAGAMDRLIASLERLAITIGESGLLQWFTDFVEGLGETIRGMGQWSKTALKWASVAALMGMAFGPLLMGLGGLMQIIPKVTLAVKDMNFAFLANPITWVIAGIAAIVLALVHLVGGWEEAGKRIAGVLGGMFAPFRAIGRFIGGFFLIASGQLRGFVEGFIALWMVIPNFFRSVWDVVAGHFERKVERMRNLVRSVQAWLPDWLGGGDSNVTVSGSDGAGVASRAAAAAVGGGGKSEAEVLVRFANLPAGAEVVQQSNDGVNLDVNRGPSMID